MNAPRRHAEHVRWLERHYAVSREEAERMAFARYRQYPQELIRWD